MDKIAAVLTVAVEENQRLALALLDIVMFYIHLSI